MTGTALVVWRKHRVKRNKPPQDKRTICEVIREMMRDAEARDDKLLIARLEEANDMAKRMDLRLRQLNEIVSTRK